MYKFSSNSTSFQVSFSKIQQVKHYLGKARSSTVPSTWNDEAKIFSASLLKQAKSEGNTLLTNYDKVYGDKEGRDIQIAVMKFYLLLNNSTLEKLPQFFKDILLNESEIQKVIHDHLAGTKPELLTTELGSSIAKDYQKQAYTQAEQDYTKTDCNISTLGNADQPCGDLLLPD